MDGWLQPAHGVDLVIACIVLEVLALAQRRPAVLKRALPSLGAGLAMAISLRLALSGAVWPWVWLCLAAAGAAHGIDVVRRWRGQQ
ncbi:MAG: hypothetical protein LH480_15930 [Rubrivivax sp.]|nr:hypothetical protein [Rubrivivax sp.]